MVLALLGLAGSASAVTNVLGWLGPVLIGVSVLLLGQAFFILYVRRRGTRVSKIITWASALVMVGYWTWRLLS